MSAKDFPQPEGPTIKFVEFFLILKLIFSIPDLYFQKIYILFYKIYELVKIINIFYIFYIFKIFSNFCFRQNNL